MKPEQLEFGAKWPHIRQTILQCPDVQAALFFGMWHQHNEYLWNHPPYRLGIIRQDRPEPKPHELSWYQPFGKCHSIVPFAWAIDRHLYQLLDWAFMTSDRHSIAIGSTGDEMAMVADILCFDIQSAEESIRYTEELPYSVVTARKAIWRNRRRVLENSAT